MDKDARISFRASSSIQQGLALSAEQAGCSVSEYLRQIVEQEVARSEVEQAIAAEGIDPFSRLGAAARGSVQAQRDIANRAVALAFDPEGRWDTVRCLEEGLIFARLAAAQGAIEDQGLVISIISLLAQVVGEENVPDEMAEALARISAVADQQSDIEMSERASEALGPLAESMPAEAVAEAKKYQQRMKG